MLIDLESTPGEVANESDVCIVGAGIAGLVMAERLSARGVKVHVLEAGGLELEERSQELYDAEMAAERHSGTTEGRFRAFGGSSTRWGGQLLPYSHDIFVPPAGAPSAAWPIDDRELKPHYDAIQKMLSTDSLPFDASLLPALGHEPVPFSPAIDLRYSKWIPFGKRNLGKTIGERLKTDANVTIFTHANVAGLEGDGTKITDALVLTYARRAFRFKATHFVVATGTIESSRLMLLSGGVPDPHEQIGRYFHDHVSFRAAEFRGAARAKMLEKMGPFLVDGTLHTCKMEASAELRAHEKLIAVMAHVVVVEPEDSGAAAVKALLTALQKGRLREGLTKNLMPMLRGLGDVVRLAVYARWKKRRSVSNRAQVRLQIDSEQVPTAETRIHLSEAKDALGMRKAVVDWRVGDAERDTAVRFAPVIAAELEKLGMEPEDWDEGLRAGRPVMVDTYHPMGGLRMGTDPAASVVDTDLRVHGLANLHVASCAVYPAGGSSNPTFTLVALALRLADKLGL